MLLVVPHPDDEVLGVGGLLRQLCGRGVVVSILAVTDGEASHPSRTEELRATRDLERVAALAALGAEVGVVRLGHPDGQVDERRLHQQIEDHLGPHDVLLSLWEHDGHPDHDACGRAARGFDNTTWSYLVWAWHWAVPADLPLQQMVRVPLSADDLEAKRRAVAQYVSQLEGNEPILPEHVLQRLVRASEILVAELP